MRLLCAADLHLGRRPSRIPRALDPIRAQLTPNAAWRSLVAVALEHRVDALLLAGDVVEHNDDFYEAYPDLLEGVEALTHAGIEVIAVSGNHDTQVLPRLAQTVPGLHLLGAGNNWEARTVHGADGTVADVVGWSFPSDVVTDSPLSRALAAFEAEFGPVSEDGGAMRERIAGDVGKVAAWCEAAVRSRSRQQTQPSVEPAASA